MIYEFDLFQSKDYGIELLALRSIKDHFVITGSDAVFVFCKKYLHMSDLAEESMVLLALNNSNSILGVFTVSKGTVGNCLINIPGIFKRLLLLDASSFILAHNHPSGGVDPSRDDDKSTTKIKQAAGILGIAFVDYVVIGKDSYYSYYKEGRF